MFEAFLEFKLNSTLAWAKLPGHPIVIVLRAKGVLLPSTFDATSLISTRLCLRIPTWILWAILWAARRLCWPILYRRKKQGGLYFLGVWSLGSCKYWQMSGSCLRPLMRM